MEHIRRIRDILIFFIFISAADIFFNQRLNGDYLGEEINCWILLLTFFLSVLTIICFFSILLKITRRSSETTTRMLPKGIITITFLVIILIRIYASLNYGYGIATQEKVNITGWFGILLKLSNRISLEFLVLIFLIGKLKFRFVYLFLFIFYSLSRYSIGIVFYLIIVFYALENSKKMRLTILGSIILFLTFLNKPLQSFLNWRNELRGLEEAQIDISGILIGRISSLSDSAYLIQKGKELKYLSEINIWEPIQKLLTSITGIKFNNYFTTELLSISSYVGAKIENIAFMNGILGNLAIYYHYNLLTLIFYLILVLGSLYLLKWLLYEEHITIIIASTVLISYAVTSGVLSDFYSFFLTIVFLKLTRNVSRLLSRRGA